MSMMQNWMDEVDHDPRGGSSPDGPGGNTIVFHTTETDRPATYNGSAPHFEVCRPSVGRTRQFVPLDSSSMALWNEPGGVQTNRRGGNVWQIEIVWRAANAQDMPDDLLEELAKVVRFIRSQGNVPLVAPPQGWWRPGTIASANGPLRFSYTEWNNHEGFCAHVHVPENDHWDCGDFPWERFLTILQGEEDMTPAEIKDLFGSITWLKEHIAPLEWLYRKLGNDDWEDGANNMAQLLMNAAMYAEQAAKAKPVAGSSLSDADIKRIIDAIYARLAS